MLLRVIPGKMVPLQRGCETWAHVGAKQQPRLSAGVEMRLPLTTKMLHDDTSSMYLFSRASRYSTSEKPAALASSCVLRTGE